MHSAHTGLAYVLYVQGRSAGRDQLGGRALPKSTLALADGVWMWVCLSERASGLLLSTWHTFGGIAAAALCCRL